MKLSALTPDTRNANKGTDRGRKLVRESLKRYGAGRSILIDKSGNVIAGNKTLEGAKAVGLEDCQVVKSDGTRLIAVQRTDLDINDKAARELAIADNRASELGLEWDADVLKALETEVDVDLSPFWDDRELVQFWADPNAEAPEPQLDRAAELQAKWDTKPGQLWLIGEHRLLCGDSTSETDVARLWAGQSERGALLATDPPYGVALRLEDNHEASNAAKGIKTSYRHFEQIMGDDLEGEKLQTFLESVFRAALTVLRPNAAWYLWHAQLSQGFFAAAAAAAAAAQLLIHRQIIWVKPHFVFGRGDYHWQHELCFYGWVKGNRPEFYGERNQSTIWQLDEGGGSIRKDQDHPTQKPTSLFAIPIANHTQPGEICYEPFAGSGTQFCAAQIGKRICYGIEIEPKYVAVTLQRLFDMGLQPVLDHA